jgi:alkylhydroperoxidase family enzyme
MPRLNQVSRAEATSDVVLGSYRHIFGDRDPVAEPGTATGTPGDWWTVCALSPDVLKHAIRGFALYQSPKRELPGRLRELGQTRVGYLVGSQFVFSQHSKAARANGLSAEKVEAIPYWSVSDLFDADERAVLAYADALATNGGRVPDGVFAALREHLNDVQILELTYIASLYVHHAIMARALRVEFDDREEVVVEVAAPEGYVESDLHLAGPGA